MTIVYIYLFSSARAFKLEAILDVMGAHLEASGPKSVVLIEYIMLHGVNDAVTDAHTLGKLLTGKRCKVRWYSIHQQLQPLVYACVQIQTSLPC